jgi:hypothetical protein
MPSERGQATIDYVALIAALAIVLAAAAALATGGASGVANAVVGQVRHALCIVTGSACLADRRLPCVVASRRDARHVDGTIGIIRLDGDRYVQRERLSDGTVRLTLAHRVGGGVEVGIGGRLKIHIGKKILGIDDEARGGAEGVLGYGEVYLARDDAEADEIMQALRRRLPLIGGDDLHPTQTFFEGGGRGLGRVGLGGSAAGASLEGLAENILGARRDERTHDVTITFNAGGSGWGVLSVLLAGPSGSFDRQLSFGLTLDADQRPIELSVMATGTLAAGATLPTGLAEHLGLSDNDAQTSLSGRRWELAARLDLTDPDIAAAWSAFRHDPSNPDTVRALGATLAARANLDARTYEVHSESSGAAAGIAFGVRIGGEYDHEVDLSRLLSASTRPPGGTWERRTDCVAA